MVTPEISTQGRPAMSTGTKRMYCPSCGEEVDTFLMLDGADESHHCFFCGVRLTGEKPVAQKSLETMLVAEDSAVFREVLQDRILEMGIAREVECADNGEEFITLFTRRLLKKLPVSVAVMDIRMPQMNGINAAMALRAIEKGMGVKKPTPILFFSSVKCDDNLKQVFQHCAPARYINKGNADSPEQLTDRLLQVLGRLLAESKR
jgi:CheY-like chemotaxis protein